MSYLWYTSLSFIIHYLFPMILRSPSIFHLQGHFFFTKSNKGIEKPFFCGVLSSFYCPVLSRDLKNWL